MAALTGYVHDRRAADQSAEEIVEDPDQDGYGIGLLRWGGRGPERS